MNEKYFVQNTIEKTKIRTNERGRKNKNTQQLCGGTITLDSR